ncbi:MAG: hypothetical protein IBJ09_04285 [Bacteroidia bacterium]|nr:hypothetical protein [Bacteroidia bacterium]
METGIKNDTGALRKLLWLDTFMGASVGLAGLLLYRKAALFLGFSEIFVLIVSAVTLLYAGMACYLALRSPIPRGPLRVLVRGNWLWAGVSVVLIVLYFNEATVFGKIFLVLQVLVVGGLGYAEGKALKKSTASV